jgi:predicted metalloprotease with PDZ domain
VKYPAGVLCVLIWMIGSTAAATRSEPQPLPMPPAIAVPQDVPYPGIITVEIDATDLDHRIFRSHQRIPVAAAGPMVLLYPRWIPGSHSPNGPLHDFAGLKITADGRPVPWTRDTADVFAYHIEVPAGATELNVDSQYLSPTDGVQGAISMTHEMLRLNWSATTLYPAGHFTRRIQINASVKLPQGWEFGTALERDPDGGAIVNFKTVSYETLADSPLIAGKYFRRIDLNPTGRSRITLDVMADEPRFLKTTPAIENIHRELIRQADRLYGARHFDHYDFLLSLSELLAAPSLEHQRSSDNGTTTSYFTSWDASFLSRDLLAHEYNHSWNGKNRRPADLWTPNFNVPMRDSLLWVYEGQTQYYGNVLAARAGFLSKQQALDSLALTAAIYDARVGREWRALQDTTNDPIITARRAIPWITWQRSEDYYSEGQLVWLDVDTLLRELSHGRRSLDDFARDFFGMNDGDWGQLTYTFEDVVAALNKVAAYDWAAFLRTRLDEHVSGAPLDGLRRGGYRLIYTDAPTEFFRDSEARHKAIDLTYSLGLVLDPGGRISGVRWESPAFKAGLTAGMDVVAFNNMSFDGERLKTAIRASKDDDAPFEFIVKQNDSFRTVRIDYHDGARYPRLERIRGSVPLLDDILSPLR